MPPVYYLLWASPVTLIWGYIVYFSFLNCPFLGQYLIATSHAITAGTFFVINKLNSIV